MRGRFSGLSPEEIAEVAGSPADLRAVGIAEDVRVDLEHAAVRPGDA